MGGEGLENGGGFGSCFFWDVLDGVGMGGGFNRLRSLFDVFVLIDAFQDIFSIKAYNIFYKLRFNNFYKSKINKINKLNKSKNYQ